jgi:predicted transcriptional regulator
VEGARLLREKRLKGDPTGDNDEEVGFFTIVKITFHSAERESSLDPISQTEQTHRPPR